MAQREYRLEEIFPIPEGDLRFFGTIGVQRIAENEDGSVEVTLPASHALLNGHDTMQGGAIYALCDVAAGAYMRIHFGDSSTVSSGIQFFRPVREGAVLTARVTPRKEGKTLVTLQVEVSDEAGLRIADSQQTMFRL